MHRENKTISRRELYDQVWATPVTQLAREYGLSDVGFAKICKRHNIPRPPRGYWAQLAAGYQLPKEPLPNRSLDKIIEITPNVANQLSAMAGTDMAEQIENEKKLPSIVVPKSLRSPHPFVSQSAELLELCQPNDIGILEPKDKRCLDIRVSKKTLRRALRIMDALIKGLLDRGFDVSLEDGRASVRVNSEVLVIGISEEIRSIKKESVDADIDGYYHFGHSRFDYIREPSGTLCLTIHDKDHYWDDQFRKNWRDTKRRQVEDILDGFVIGLIKRAAQKKEYRRQKEEEERQRQELARQREEATRRREELKCRIKKEQARVTQLITDADNYNKSKQIRGFISAVENQRLQGNPVYVVDEDYENWIRWARDQADRLDPLSESLPSILDQAIEIEEQPGENDEFDTRYRRW